MDLALSLLSTIGVNSIVLFLITRYFNRRDKREQEALADRKELRQRIDTSLETLRLLAYARLSQEIERLLDQGFATPQERRYLGEMVDNYHEHKWNGDMDARLAKVYAMRSDHPE